VSLLLDAGADKNCADREANLTPALWAARNGHRESLLVLLRAGARPAAAGTTVLHVAARHGHRALVDDIATIYPNPKAWHVVLMGSGSSAPLPQLRRRSRRLEKPLVQRSSPLGQIYKKDVLRLIHSFLHKPRYLKNLDYLDDQGKTAAQWAQEKGHTKIAKLLKKNGAAAQGLDDDDDSDDDDDDEGAGGAEGGGGAGAAGAGL
jgi:ankyrin repeat protein